MSLNTSLKDRLRNTNLPKSHVLFPLFEAVVNSIHSIDERIQLDQEFEISKTYIKVKVIRSTQKTLDDSKSDIIGFEIIDSGIGFNKNNYESFQTLDSEYKIEQLNTKNRAEKSSGVYYRINKNHLYSLRRNRWKYIH